MEWIIHLYNLSERPTRWHVWNRCAVFLGRVKMGSSENKTRVHPLPRLQCATLEDCHIEQHLARALNHSIFQLPQQVLNQELSLMEDSGDSLFSKILSMQSWQLKFQNQRILVVCWEDGGRRIHGTYWQDSNTTSKQSWQRLRNDI